MPLLNLGVAQLLLVFVVANVVRKLDTDHLFLGWLSKRLNFCCMPTNEELKEIGHSQKHQDIGASSNKKNKQKAKKRNATQYRQQTDNNDSETFKVRTIDLRRLNLETTQLNARILSLFPRGTELERAIDFAMMSGFCFLITQVLIYLYQDPNGHDFSVIWMLLVVILSLVSLGRITASYFTLDKSVGERSLCIVFGCIFFLVAMMILIADENRLDLGLDSAFTSLSESFAARVDKADVPLIDVVPPKRSNKTISFIMAKFFVAMICSSIGVILTFPGLRFGQLHEALLERPQTNALQKIGYIFNYLSNLVVICLWIKPLTRDVLIKHKTLGITEDNFDSYRSIVIIGVNLFRLYLAPVYISTFLASGTKYMEQIRQRGSTTTNKEIRFAISSINNYVNIVAIQYILPTLACLYIATIIPTKSSSMTDSLVDNPKSYEYLSSMIGEQSVVIERLMNGFKAMFSVPFCKGVFGFAAWWIHFSWFCTTTAGVIYHKYFTHTIY